GEQRNEIAKHMRGGRKTMEQENDRRAPVAGFAVEQLSTIDLGSTVTDHRSNSFLPGLGARPSISWAGDQPVKYKIKGYVSNLSSVIFEVTGDGPLRSQRGEHDRAPPRAFFHRRPPRDGLPQQRGAPRRRACRLAGRRRPLSRLACPGRGG